MDPGDGHAAGLQRDHEEDQVTLEPGQREHLNGEQIAGREALPVRLQERLPGHAPAPLGSRVDPVVVQDPLHRGPSDLVAEVRERPADPCVPPLGILDRHPDHARGHVTSRHRPASTAAGAAVVCLGDQSPVPAENRVRRDDAGDLHPDAPSEFLAAHGESTALGIGQAVPLSHPFVERLIGTMRREFLDHVLFWNAGDLERKLADFQAYYNAARSHASLEGYTPLGFAGERTAARAEFNHVRWISHCRGMVQLPAAA